MTQTTTAAISQAGSLSSRVATRVRMLMAAHRKSNKDLATLLELSERQALRKKNGEEPFRLRELETVALWLGVEPESLLSGAGIPEAIAS